MHVHASTVSTADKIVILGKIILSNYDATEFDTTLFGAICQTPDAFRIFWPEDLEGCSLHKQPHRGHVRPGLCEMTN